MKQVVVGINCSSSSFGATRDHRRGTTLLEVMISMLVITVVVMIFAGSVSVGQRAAGLNGEYSQAISLCQHKIDQLRTVGYGRLTYEELSDAEIIDSNPSSPPYRFIQVDNVSQYLSNASATIDLYSTGDPEVIRVVVNLTWRNGSYATKQSHASLTALIANTE